MSASGGPAGRAEARAAHSHSSAQGPPRPPIQSCRCRAAHRLCAPGAGPWSEDCRGQRRESIPPGPLPTSRVSRLGADCHSAHASLMRQHPDYRDGHVRHSRRFSALRRRPARRRRRPMASEPTRMISHPNARVWSHTGANRCSDGASSAAPDEAVRSRRDCAHETSTRYAIVLSGRRLIVTAIGRRSHRIRPTASIAQYTR